MITFGKLGSHGRLANQLFQIAATIGLSKRHNKKYVLPYWRYSEYFKRSLNLGNIDTDIVLKEKDFHYSEDPFNLIPEFGEDQIELMGYFQSEKYWREFKYEIKNQFEFKDSLVTRLFKRVGHLYTERTICLHVRRGDYVDNPNYELLDIKYYMNAILSIKNYERHNILVFSDDYNYCKTHFSCLQNAYFMDEFNDIESLCLMSKCDSFILSNSSFSWWAAYLGESEDSQVIRPRGYFAGKLLEKCDIKDFWPGHWSVIDEKKNLDLKDVEFIIPFKYDSIDRFSNITFAISNLKKYFNTNISVKEQGGNFLEDKDLGVNYSKSTLPVFHRTKMLNQMTMDTELNIVVNYDTDVILPPLQLYLAAKMLRDKEADFVSPYDGRFLHTTKDLHPLLVIYNGDSGYFPFGTLRGNERYDSLGGCIMFRKEKFIEAGMENENFISYAPEDKERYWRFIYLGYKLERIKGPLFHLDHFRGPDSSHKHDFYKKNEEELHKEMNMSVRDLIKYISTWKHLPKN